MSPKTTFMTPADITGEPEIKIAAPTVSSVLGTSKAGYLIKGTAEPNRIIQISNRLLRSVIAVGATDAEGNFAIQLTAGQATAQQSLLAIATDGAGHYSTATTFMTPADPTNPEEAMVTLAEITAIQETMAQLAGIMGMVQTQVQIQMEVLV